MPEARAGVSYPFILLHSGTSGNKHIRVITLTNTDTGSVINVWSQLCTYTWRREWWEINFNIHLNIKPRVWILCESSVNILTPVFSPGPGAGPQRVQSEQSSSRLINKSLKPSCGAATGKVKLKPAPHKRVWELIHEQLLYVQCRHVWLLFPGLRVLFGPRSILDSVTMTTTTPQWYVTACEATLGGETAQDLCRPVPGSQV